jgi:hypothetical protein
MAPEDTFMTETMAGEGLNNAPTWPRLRPHGGSKWAPFFAAPLHETPSASTLTRHQNAVCTPQGRVSHDPAPAEITSGKVFAVPAGADVPTGLWLSHVLPGIFKFFSEHREARLAGAALTAGQHDLLVRLGWQASYLTLTAPARFAEVLTISTDFDAGAFAGLIERLRPAQRPREASTLAILPAGAGETFSLRNRSSLTAWLRARRILLLPSDMVSFEARAASLASATQVLLADPAQAGLLGLCAAGTKVLELAPEGWVSGQVRAICQSAGLEWQLFLGTAPSYPVLKPASFGATSSLSYELPIATLGKTLAAL